MNCPYEPLLDLTDPVVFSYRVQAYAIARQSHCFWLPCPLCGLEFGGQEWKFTERYASVHLPGDPLDTQTAICPWCTDAGRGREYAEGKPLRIVARDE